ncbi:GNAT family N-acetyltransferase [Halapricum sp. CBA1109]|nr:GNAT family N-acetyltransferase [Halapricum sp. CBA1109]MUV89279.1 GNAT family N-acetyltransferase [Halapricum sp. CBA1109]
MDGADEVRERRVVRERPVGTADADDAAAIVEVKQTAIGELAASTYTPTEQAAWSPDDAAETAFRDALGADAFQVLVADDGGTIVGYGVLNAEAGTVDALFVRPFWARTGIATRLLSHLEMSAAVAGCTALSAVVSLNAVPFYETVGYERVEPCSRTIDGTELDFVRMRKQLDT